MPWKAKRRKYDCPKCGYVIGGLSVPLKRLNPSETCPECGTKLRANKCRHPEVRELAGSMSCRTCHCLVVWVDK